MHRLHDACAKHALISVSPVLSLRRFLNEEVDLSSTAALGDIEIQVDANEPRELHDQLTSAQQRQLTLFGVEPTSWD